MIYNNRLSNEFLSNRILNNFAACDYFGVTWHDNDYTPKKGNLIFFDYDGYFDKPYSVHADHVGIVTDVDSSYVYTIEGNSNNAVTEHKYSLTYSCIKGYGSYEDSTSVEADAEETDVIRTLKDNLPFKASLAENCKINAYSDYGVNKVGRVYESDIFVVKAIEHKNYTWWAKIDCPWTENGRSFTETVYIKLTDIVPDLN